jgi:hypothetical protein
MHGVLVPPGGRGGGGIRAWRSILDGILLNSVNFEFFANKIKKYRNVMVKKRGFIYVLDPQIRTGYGRE